MCLAHAKRRSSVKIKMGIYKIDALTYFHSCVNSIWYRCCLTLEGQYLKKDLLFVKLAHNFKTTLKAKFQNQLSFRICYHSLSD